MSTSWAFVRQVIFATPDPSGDSTLLRDSYALAQGFRDPLLLEYGIADETIPVGAEQYIELLSPSGDASPLHAWLARTGGPGGYGVAVQVPDIAAIRERAIERGVKVLIDQEALGHRVMQLNPRQVGILLDLDGVADRSTWFWDDITPGPAAGATIDGVAEVEIGVPDPAATAALWASLLGVDQLSETTVDLGTTISFVAAERGAITAVTMYAAPGAAVSPDTSMLGVTIRHRAR